MAQPQPAYGVRSLPGGRSIAITRRLPAPLLESSALSEDAKIIRRMLEAQERLREHDGWQPIRARKRQPSPVSSRTPH